MIPPHSERATPPGLGFVGFAVLFFFCSFAPSLLAQTPGGGSEEVYEKSLFYHLAIPELDAHMPETGELMVVPISRLRANLTQEATAASIPSEQLAEVVYHVNQVAERLDRERCSISPSEWGRKPLDPNHPRDSDVLDFIAAREIVLFGTIEHLTESWEFAHKAVVTIVFVRIEEVMRDATGSFAAGQLVTFVRPWGEATILGIPLCTNPPTDVSAERSSQVGGQIVLTGDKDLRNPDHLVTHPSRIYPVVEGVVSPPAGAVGYSDRTVALAEVRERLR